jgi:class 3 adenylate cyclase
LRYAEKPTAQTTERDFPVAAPASSPPVAPAVAAAPDAERRQLTVMFCDLVGSTALSTGMDPEDLRDVIASYQSRCSAAIRRYDGFVAKYAARSGAAAAGLERRTLGLVLMGAGVAEIDPEQFGKGQ